MKKETKVYVLEWDAWRFFGVYSTYKKAKSKSNNYMETVKTITIDGDVVDNKLFIVIDGTREWHGIFPTEKEAIARLESRVFKGDYEIKEIELL